MPRLYTRPLSQGEARAARPGTVLPMVHRTPHIFAEDVQNRPSLVVHRHKVTPSGDEKLAGRHLVMRRCKPKSSVATNVSRRTSVSLAQLYSVDANRPVGPRGRGQGRRVPHGSRRVKESTCSRRKPGLQRHRREDNWRFTAVGLPKQLHKTLLVHRRLGYSVTQNSLRSPRGRLKKNSFEGKTSLLNNLLLAELRDLRLALAKSPCLSKGV